MRDFSHGRIRQQVSFLRRQFLQEGDMPFASVLSKETIAPALEAIEGCWNDRIYTPLMTLWVFLGQVISADHSCRAAVARLIVHRISRGQLACSSRTGAYCQARKRLPEKFFSAVTCLVGSSLDSFVVDGISYAGGRTLVVSGPGVNNGLSFLRPRHLAALGDVFDLVEHHSLCGAIVQDGNN